MVRDFSVVPATTAPSRVQPTRSATVFYWLACVSTITTILYWRRPDAFYNPQLWAEDGSRFFSNPFFFGAQTLWMPFAGYYHTLARLVALIGYQLPIGYAPHWYAFASWLLLVAVVCYLFSPRFSFANGQKYLLGLALVATTAGNEVFFNLANWPTITTLFWLLLAIADEPKNRRQALFDALLLVGAGLNSPFTVCLWVLFLLRWSIRRTKPSLALLLLSIAVGLVQFWHMPARVASEPASTLTLDLYDAVLYRFGFMFLGEWVLQWSPTNLLRGVGLLLVFGSYGWLVGQAVGQRKWAQLAILIGGLAAALLSLYVQRYHPQDLAFSSGRHFYLPAVTLAWALLLTNRRWSWPPLALILVAFLWLTPGSKGETLPDLDWAGRVAGCIASHQRCKIPVNPVAEPQVWYADLIARRFAPPPLQTAYPVRFGQQIELLGYDFTQAPATVSLRFAWQALARMPADFGLFVQLVDPADPNRIWLETEIATFNGGYQTSLWQPHEVVVDQVDLTVSALPPGQYVVVIGWHNPARPGEPLLAAKDPAGRAVGDGRVRLPLTVNLP